MDNYEDNEDFGFDTEFMTDEEVEEMIDFLAVSLGEQIEAEHAKTSIINIRQIQKVSYVYKVMKYLTKGQSGVKVERALHAPYHSIGYVSVVGKHLIFRKPEWFMRAVEFSNNFEIYPKTNGTVQMNFTFHGLTTPIE